MRILVVGAGAIGGLIASELALGGGHDVLLAVRGEVSALVLEEDGSARTAPVTLVQDPAHLPSLDIVVLATKAYDVPGVRSWLEAPQTRRAFVVVAQNGIEHAERLAGLVPGERVVPAIVKHAVERRGPGHVERTSRGDIKVPDTGGGRMFVKAGEGSTLGIVAVEDFETALWVKLAYNLVGNSISTIADLEVRALGEREPLRRLIFAMVDECATVAAGRGVVLPPGLARTIVDEFASYPDSIHSSMWQDLRSGRPFEHDAISGAVVRAAAAQGMHASFAEMATLLLEAKSPARDE